jgi:N-acetylglucosaminyl-diphospho-decaprenol L-rhamnosyltransferase
MAHLSILVVSYNTRRETLACLRSVFGATLACSREVIVVDNASSDGSCDAIRHEFPDAQLIGLRRNVGFARANNIAARRAKGDMLLLLNPDTVVTGNAIESLLRFAAQHRDAGIWGGRTVFPDGTLNPSSCWGFMSLPSLFCQAVGLSALFRGSGMFNREAYGGWARDGVREVDIVTGCFLLIRRQTWEDLGGFDERFFMYAEEADLCYRARGLGCRPMFTPEASIVHIGGASESVFAPKCIRLLSAKATFMNKHWPGWRSRLGVAILKLHVLSRHAGHLALLRLTRSPRHGERAGEWRNVWRARTRWERGYSRTGDVPLPGALHELDRSLAIPNPAGTGRGAAEERPHHD